ncbi:MAG: cytidine deaminase [Fimbriimonas sp.]
MDPLIEAAREVRRNAYAPYSNYLVGAAIEDVDGRVFAGVNVENISYGATICAERAAVVKMVSEGGRKAKRLALVTSDGGNPCGICLQVLSEFTDDPTTLTILIADETKTLRTHRLSELLPFAFDSSRVE